MRLFNNTDKWMFKTVDAHAGGNGSGDTVLVHPRVLLGSDGVTELVLACGEEGVDEGAVVRDHRFGCTVALRGRLALPEGSALRDKSGGESSDRSGELHG